MTRRMIEREYAPEECDEICQDILTQDRYEIRQRTNRNNCGCQRRNEYDRSNEILNPRTNFAQQTRTSGEECPMGNTNCQWEDPCRCHRYDCGCYGQRYNHCGCIGGRNCDRNRRLRSCRCGCNED